MKNNYREAIKRRVSKALRKIMEKKGFGSYEEMYRYLVRKGYNKSFSTVYSAVVNGTERLGFFMHLCELLEVDGVKLLNEEVLNG